MSTNGPGVPLASLTDRSAFGFDVHRAVETPGPDFPDLPTYVERAHDRSLRAVIDRAAAGESGLVTVVGSSSTGKTRACWEAIRSLPDGWRLWHPVYPTPSQAFLAAVDAVVPRTVVWLNEAQLYLLDRPAGGERVAAAVRVLLADTRPAADGGRGPVLVVATLWPEYWRTLTARPESGRPDVFAQQRALLTDVGLRVSVPDAFSCEDLVALGKSARSDPRLALAAGQAGQGKVTQFLAGAPQLLARYTDAAPAVRALIHAAMDARRLGHSPALPFAFLADAAEGYLGDDEFDAIEDDWLEQALAACAEPAHGTPGPLTRIRPRRGEPALPGPVYRLADYLEQHGRDERRYVCPPAAFWEAALRGIGDPDALGALANAAARRGLVRLAVALYEAEIRQGPDRHQAMGAVAQILTECGRVDDALAWYERASVAGDEGALYQAGRALEDAGRVEEAIAWYLRDGRHGDTLGLQQAVRLANDHGFVDEVLAGLRDIGSTHAWRHAAGLLWTVGRVDDALEGYILAGADCLNRDVERVAWWLQTERPGSVLPWLTRVAAAGHPRAMHQAADRMVEAGHVRDAITFLCAVADTAGRDGWLKAGDLAWSQGCSDEAVGLWRRAAHDAQPRLLAALGRSWWHADRPEDAVACWDRVAATDKTRHLLDEARELLNEHGREAVVASWWRHRADTGEAYGCSGLAAQLARTGELDEAVRWWERSAAAGDDAALGQAAIALWDGGRENDARALWWRAARTGHLESVNAGVERLRNVGHGNEAEQLWWCTARAGTSWSLKHTVRRMEADGEIEELVALLRELTEAGHHEALWKARYVMTRHGRVDEAFTWLRGLHDAGHPSAAWHIGQLLSDCGRLDRALTWWRRAGESGGYSSAARALDEAGRLDDSLEWFHLAVEAGDIDLAWTAAKSYAQAGRADDFVTWMQQRARTGDRLALRVAVECLDAAGRSDTAKALRRHGWEPNGDIAPPW